MSSGQVKSSVNKSVVMYTMQLITGNPTSNN